MSVNIKEILEKYPTKINLDKMNDILLNHEIPNITIDDVEEPLERESDGKIGLLYRTKKDYIVTVSETSVGHSWKDEYGYTHTINIDSNGTIINT